MTDRRTSLADAAALVTDGSSVGIGGVLDRHRPLAMCRALVDAGRSGLHVWSFLAGPELTVLLDGGAVTGLTAGYVEPAAALPRLTASAVEWREVSEQIFVGGLLAAGSGLPFWPTLGATGSDVAARLELRDVRCPYTGRDVLAVPATPLDVALLHAPAATASGAVVALDEREFLDDADATLARAARTVIVTVDRIADDAEVAGGRRTVLAPFEVDAVVVVGAAA